MEQDGSIDLGEQGFSFKETAMRGFREACLSLSVELRGGYYLDAGGDNSKEVYVPDTRDVACNTVFVLAVLLLPKIKIDPVSKKVWADFEENLKVLEENFIKKTVTKESVVLGADYYNEVDRLGFEEFKINRLRLHIILFKELSELLGRKNYLEMGGGTFN